MSATAASSTPISANDQIIDRGDDMTMKRRKDLIGDCALVEIIHLHDCFRGALNALEKDLVTLGKMVLRPHSKSNSAADELGGTSNTESIDELHQQQLHQQPGHRTHCRKFFGLARPILMNESVYPSRSGLP